MKKFFVYGLLVLSLAMGGCAKTEQILTGWAIGAERSRAHLSLKQVQIENFRVPYLEGGQGETIFLIHGFQSNKDIWVRLAGQLTDKYHVIAIDLPAHGESNIMLDKSYTIAEQVRRVVTIMEKLQLKQPVHVVGHSMGGAIALNLAATAPQHVKTLGLISAAGVVSPQPSQLQLALAKGKNPLIVKTKDDYQAMLEFTMSKSPYIPGPLVSVFTQEAIEREPIAQKIFKDINSQVPQSPEKVLPKIAVPVLVLWGDEDKVLDVSATDVFKKWLPRSEVVILKGVGHAPQIESTKETAEIIRTFLSHS